MTTHSEGKQKAIHEGKQIVSKYRILFNAATNKSKTLSLMDYEIGRFEKALILQKPLSILERLKQGKQNTQIERAQVSAELSEIERELFVCKHRLMDHLKSHNITLEQVK